MGAGQAVENCGDAFAVAAGGRPGRRAGRRLPCHLAARGNHINAERRFCRYIEGLKGPAIYAFVYFTLLLIAIDMTCFSNALSGIVRNLTSISSFGDSILYSLGGRL